MALRLAFLQSASLRAICAIMNCPRYAEMLLVPRATQEKVGHWRRRRRTRGKDRREGKVRRGGRVRRDKEVEEREGEKTGEGREGKEKWKEDERRERKEGKGGLKN